MPTYLESSHPQNRPIYARMGFEYVKSIYLTRESEDDVEGKEKGRGIELEIMVREPRLLTNGSGKH